MNVYEIVTETIIGQLEQGTAPWQMPWTVRDSAPRNITGRRYHGINVFLLVAHGHASPYWLTWNQIKARGGNVRKGERGAMIVFWKSITVDDDTADNGRKTIPLLRYYRVWNLTQVDGIADPDPVDSDEFAEDADAESIVTGYLSREGSPTATETGRGAAYSPVTDSLVVPPRSAFASADDFYATLFHEMAHSTGHASRLNRAGIASFDHFGSDRYSREELVAEMTAAFLTAEADITATIESHAAYLAGWVRALREDVRAVVVAAGAAQRAADHILGRVAVEAEREALAA